MKASFNCILPAVLFLLLSRYNQESQSPTTEITSILTHAVWTQMESWKDTDGDGIFNFDTPDCQADNHWDFHADGSFLLTEDSLKCEPDLPFLDTLSCSWNLTNNETVLGLSMPASQEEMDFQIIAIGDQEIILHLIDPEYPNEPVREKIILRR